MDSPGVCSKQGSLEVGGGRRVNVICSHFNDRVFLLISDLDKVGTMVRKYFNY